MAAVAGAHFTGTGSTRLYADHGHVSFGVQFFGCCLVVLKYRYSCSHPSSRAAIPAKIYPDERSKKGDMYAGIALLCGYQGSHASLKSLKVLDF